MSLREELRRIGLPEALVRPLGEVVAGHSTGGHLREWYDRLEAFHACPPHGTRRAHQSRADRVLHQARALARHLEAADALLTDPLLSQFVALRIAMRPREGADVVPTLRSIGVGEWRTALREILERLRAVPARPTREPGRRASLWRESFCLWVARVMSEAGVEPTKSSNGLFAKTLVLAFAAAGENPPEDVFPLVRRAVDRIKREPL